MDATHILRGLIAQSNESQTIYLIGTSGLLNLPFFQSCQFMSNLEARCKKRNSRRRNVLMFRCFAIAELACFVPGFGA